MRRNMRPPPREEGRTINCIVRLNVDSDAKLTDGGNPFHTLTMRSAKFFPNIIDTSRLKQFVCVTSCVCCMIKLEEIINVHTH